MPRGIRNDGQPRKKRSDCRNHELAHMLGMDLGEELDKTIPKAQEPIKLAHTKSEAIVHDYTDDDPGDYPDHKVSRPTPPPPPPPSVNGNWDTPAAALAKKQPKEDTFNTFRFTFVGGVFCDVHTVSEHTIPKFMQLVRGKSHNNVLTVAERAIFLNQVLFVIGID